MPRAETRSIRRSPSARIALAAASLLAMVVLMIQFSPDRRGPQEGLVRFGHVPDRPADTAAKPAAPDEGETSGEAPPSAEPAAGAGAAATVEASPKAEPATGAEAATRREAPDGPSPATDGSMFPGLGAAGLTLVLLALLAVALRARRPRKTGGALSVTERLDLGGGAALRVVEFDGSRLLIALSPAGVQLLHASPGPTAADGRDAKPSFDRLLSDATDAVATRTPGDRVAGPSTALSAGPALHTPLARTPAGELVQISIERGA